MLLILVFTHPQGREGTSSAQRPGQITRKGHQCGMRAVAPPHKTKSWTSLQQPRSPPAQTRRLLERHMQRPPRYTRTAVSKTILSVRVSCSQVRHRTGSSTSGTCTANTACQSRGSLHLLHTSSRFLHQQEDQRLGMEPRAVPGAQAVSTLLTAFRRGEEAGMAVMFTQRATLSNWGGTMLHRPGGQMKTRQRDTIHTRLTKLSNTKSRGPPHLSVSSEARSRLSQIYLPHLRTLKNLLS